MIRLIQNKTCKNCTVTFKSNSANLLGLCKRCRVRRASDNWKSNNPERNKEISKDWYKENSHIVSEKSRALRQARRVKKVTFSKEQKRMYYNFKDRLRRDYNIRMPLETLIGGTKAEFVAHIEKMFKKEMSWSNYGRGTNKWCVDHIISLSCFDLTKECEVLAANSLSNLQPLWFGENISKR